MTLPKKHELGSWLRRYRKDLSCTVAAGLACASAVVSAGAHL